MSALGFYNMIYFRAANSHTICRFQLRLKVMNILSDNMREKEKRYTIHEFCVDMAGRPQLWYTGDITPVIFDGSLSTDIEYNDHDVKA